MRVLFVQKYLPAEMIGEFEFADALSDDLSQGLVCIFGEDDRITASATGGSLVGLASTLGLFGAQCAERNLIEEVPATSTGLDGGQGQHLDVLPVVLASGEHHLGRAIQR